MIKKINIDEGMNLKTKLLIFVFLLLSFVYLLDKFFDTYTFVSPIKKLEFQSPLQKRNYNVKKQALNGKNNKEKVIYLSGGISKKTPQKTAKNEQKKAYQTISNSTLENNSNIKEYPKYLTDEAFILRNKILNYLKDRLSKNELIAFDNIIKKESGYDPTIVNEIGAGGICQAYPHSKMNCELSYEDWQCQVDWCLNYIKNRYLTPIEAWEFHLINNWF